MRTRDLNSDCRCPALSCGSRGLGLAPFHTLSCPRFCGCHPEAYHSGQVLCPSHRPQGGLLPHLAAQEACFGRWILSLSDSSLGYTPPSSCLSSVIENLTWLFIFSAVRRKGKGHSYASGLGLGLRLRNAGSPWESLYLGKSRAQEASGFADLVQ